MDRGIMASIVPSRVPVSFDYSAFDGVTGLFIAILVYNVTAASPVVVGSIIPMSHVFGGTYVGKVTFQASVVKQTYLIQKSVYTDATYTTISTTGGINNYGPGSETVEVDGFDNNNSTVI
jgi:hypothetical protein